MAMIKMILYKVYHTVCFIDEETCEQESGKVVPKGTVQPSIFVMITSDGHDDNISL